MGGQWGRTHGHLRSSTRMGAAGPHPVSLNISNGFRWGKGPGQVGMGTGGPSGTPGSSMALCTLHPNLERERGLEAEFKHWGGGAFPGLPPTKAPPPQSKEVANGGEHLQATHLESQFNRWEELPIVAIYRHGPQPPLPRATSR